MTERGPRASRPRVRDKEGKQRALLVAAADVFAESGYDSAHTKEIARRAGCSESLIFRYFGDKQGLFEHVVAAQGREATRRGEERAADPYADAFADYVTALFAARLPENNEVRQWDVAARGLTDREFARRTIAPIHAQRIAVIAAGVREYQARGEVDAALDPTVLAEVIGNLVNITVILGPRLFGTTGAEVAAAIALAAGVVAEGVRPATG